MNLSEERDFKARFGEDEARHSIGANNPPSPIEIGKDTFADVSKWLASNPVVADEETAREAAKLIKRAEGSLREIESERDAKVRPLNKQVADINDKYKQHHNTDKKKPGTLDKIYSVLTARLAAFMRAEEDRKAAEAERARLIALEAERVAREIEAREREALENAAHGELDIDIGGITAEADAAFRDAGKADRMATRAERDMPARISGGYGRVLSLHNVETLTVTDPVKAVAAIGSNETLNKAILTAARAYRKLNDKLPDGVKAEYDRSM